MRNRGAGGFGRHSGWETLIDYTVGTVNFVVGVTTLFSFINYGSDYSELALFVENQDGSISVRAVLDCSHGGLRVCDDMQRFSDVAAGKEGLALVEYSNPATYLRGQVTNAGGSTVAGRWALLGKQRGGIAAPSP